MFNPSVLGTTSPPQAGPAGFSSSKRFNSMFQKMLGKQAKRKNLPGMDKARGLGQAKAANMGKRGIKRTPVTSSIDPVAAAMQHSVRNRSVEQASNASKFTAVGGTSASRFVLKFLGDK